VLPESCRHLLTGVGENGEFRADDHAELAVYTGITLALCKFRVMIALGILFPGFLQDLFGTELDANIAAFAAPRDQKDPAVWDDHAIQVQWGTLVYLHDTSSLRLYNKAALTAWAGEQSVRAIIPENAASY
jgi:hypothetical protein